VDRLNRRIAQDFAIVGCNRWDRKSSAQAPRRIRVPSRNRDCLYKLDPPHRFQVHSPHEAGSDNCRPDCFHLALIRAI
jgi:hypothetical protein